MIPSNQEVSGRQNGAASFAAPCAMMTERYAIISSDGSGGTGGDSSGAGDGNTLNDGRSVG